MNTGYLIQRAERIPSAAEQRQIDEANAQLVASIARFGHTLAAPLRALRPLYKDSDHARYNVPAARRADCG